MASGTVHVGSYTFAVTPYWTPEYEYTRPPNEILYGVIHNWKVEGYLSSGTATGTINLFDTLRTQFEEGGVQEVLYKLDGVTKASLSESNLDFGPIIRNLQIEKTDGGFANHVKYSFDVFGKQAKSISGIVRVEKTVNDTSDQSGRTITTTFLVEGTQHKVYSRTLLPAGGYVSGVTYRDDETNLITTATFTEKRKGSLALKGGGGSEEDGEAEDFTTVSETITIEDNLRENRWYRIFQNDPIRIKASLGPARVTVSGRAEAFQRDTLNGGFAIPEFLTKDDLDSTSISEIFVSEFQTAGEPLKYARTWNIVATVRDAAEMRAKIASFGESATRITAAQIFGAVGRGADRIL